MGLPSGAGQVNKPLIMTLQDKKLVIPIIILAILLLMSGLGLNTSCASSDRQSSEWSHGIKLTIDHTKISAPLNNFPVLVHLSESSGENSADVSFLFNTLTSDINRKKIAFVTSDGKTECYAEIEKWDAVNKQAYLWVRVPRISNTLDTDLYLYYDKNHADNNLMVGDIGSTPAKSVWDNNFVAVWHLTESGNGTTGEFKDSTIHTHNGTGGAGVASRTPQRVDTPTGYGQRFDGIDDYIEIPDHDDFSVDTTKDLTVSFSISPYDLNMEKTGRGYVRYLAKGDAYGNLEWQFVLYNKDPPNEGRSQWTSFYNYSPSADYGTGSAATGAIPLHSWLRLTGESHQVSPTNGTVVIWRNGAYNSSIAQYTDYNVNYANGNAPVRIGNEYGHVSPSDYFNGIINEVRISNVSRSIAWEKASTYSENDNLLTFGVLSSQAPAVPIGTSSGIAALGSSP